MQLLLVALGGALGSATRFALAELAVRSLGPGFPYGIIGINALGSAAIAFLAGLSLGEDTRLFLTTGLLGGFTTYSTFNQATVAYLQQGAWLSAGANVFGTVALCLAAGVGGTMAARLVTG